MKSNLKEYKIIAAHTCGHLSKNIILRNNYPHSEKKELKSKVCPKCFLDELLRKRDEECQISGNYLPL